MSAALTEADRAPKHDAIDPADRGPSGDRHYGIGILAGAIGGVFAGAVKLGCEVVVSPRGPGRLPPPDVLISKFTHEPAAHAASLAIHFAFSTLAGALYGGLMESVAFVGLGMGTAYGLAVWIGFHEVLLPLLGLTPPVPQLPASEQIDEALTHGIWGWTIEVFRRDLRDRFIGGERV